jgi:LemA protein
MMTVERYPELKANQAFLQLQSQLEGTENRIKVARDKFNGTVSAYNKSVRKMPSAFVASITGFGEKGMFEAEAGADQAPDVNFE